MNGVVTIFSRAVLDLFRDNEPEWLEVASTLIDDTIIAKMSPNLWTKFTNVVSI